MLFITTNETIWVFERTTRLSYEEKCCVKYENKLPSVIKVEEVNYVFDKDIRKWRKEDLKVKSVS